MMPPRRFVAFCLLSACSAAHSQLHQAEHTVSLDSGAVINRSGEAVVVFSEIVTVEGAGWIRLMFSEADLAPGALLRITSVADGASQRLDRVTLEQWASTSAYFNGNTVLIELIAEPGTAASRVAIDRVLTGDASLSMLGAPGLCDGTDDRTASADPRVGRILPSLCSAWIADDCAHCLITEGFCSTGSSSVVQFNVPASSPECGFMHPPPEDQYPVDTSSRQSEFFSQAGGNWAYFGVFPNANTGLPPAEAQGGFFTRAAAVPASGDVTLIGFGGTAVCNDFSQASDTGPLTGGDELNVTFRADAPNEGSFGGPVVLVETGEVVGTLSYIACDSTFFGGNLASRARSDSADLDGIDQAIARPLGVCIPPAPPAFEFLQSDPRVIPTGGGTVTVRITAAAPIVLDSSSALLQLSSDGAISEIPLAPIGDDRYTGTLPPGTCGSDAWIRVSIDGMPTNLPPKTYDFPRGEPLRAVYADSVTTLAEFDMETDPGWTVSGIASAGGWDRAVPADFGRGDPVTDADGSGRAYVTGAMENEDLDGGPVRLTTTPFDVSTLGDPELVVSLYHFTNDPGRANGADPLEVEASDDNGATWTILDTRAHTADWRTRRYRLADFIDVSGTAVLRFTSTDSNPGSIVESAVDAVWLRTIRCGPCLADLNGNGELDPGDFTAWITAYNAQDPAADQNCDGLVTPSDFGAWIANYNAGC